MLRKGVRLPSDPVGSAQGIQHYRSDVSSHMENLFFFLPENLCNLTFLLKALGFHKYIPTGALFSLTVLGLRTSFNTEIPLSSVSKNDLPLLF